MLRVADLERSLGFYTEVLGMQLLRRKDYPSGRFTLAFVGYGSESDHTVLELTHNWDTDSYTLGVPTATLRWGWRTSTAPALALPTRVVVWCGNLVR